MPEETEKKQEENGEDKLGQDLANMAENIEKSEKLKNAKTIQELRGVLPDDLVDKAERLVEELRGNISEDTFADKKGESVFRPKGARRGDKLVLKRDPAIKGLVVEFFMNDDIQFGPIKEKLVQLLQEEENKVGDGIEIAGGHIEIKEII